ncbi:MAG TPA: P1 family peptidase [Polyangiaceae bacterium]|nr:P1 family peptidase [Polyangiaceae bacterium]
MAPDRAWKRSITDVPGVHVGHVTLAEGEVQTGVTAVLPYPQSVRHRKLFLGGAADGGGSAFTGDHVAADFGTFSSPIVLCNATAVGIAYDALITLGHRRDPELPVDDAWPPIVIGLDDGYLNDLRRRRTSHDDVLRAVAQAEGAPPPCGSVGIGRGLCALGGKGGVGDSALEVKIAGATYLLGALVAANGGAPPGGGEPEARAAAPAMVVVLATDAPLFPGQLREVSEAALRGLFVAAPTSGVEARIALSFSTANPIDNSLENDVQLFPARRLGEAGLGALLDSAGVVARAALRRALAEAAAVRGRKDRTAAPIRPEVVARIGDGPPA